MAQAVQAELVEAGAEGHPWSLDRLGTSGRFAGKTDLFSASHLLVVSEPVHVIADTWFIACERKSLGVAVMLYLLLFAGLTFLSYRRIWKNEH